MGPVCLQAETISARTVLIIRITMGLLIMIESLMLELMLNKQEATATHTLKAASVVIIMPRA